jgi:hypothetical protein
MSGERLDYGIRKGGDWSTVRKFSLLHSGHSGGGSFTIQDESERQYMQIVRLQSLQIL